MRVRAILEGNKILVRPDPVFVLAGEPVHWELVSRSRNARINWEIYFEHDTPFGRNLKSLIAATAFDSRRFSDAMHYGLSPSVMAIAPGDYKYGVRAQDAETEETLADDDPHLIVLG
jgi:hypothetical protein